VTGGILKKGENLKGEDLFGKMKGNEFPRSSKRRFVAGHTALSLKIEGKSVRLLGGGYRSNHTVTMPEATGKIAIFYVSLQAQRKSKGLRAFAQSLLTAGLCPRWLDINLCHLTQ